MIDNNHIFSMKGIKRWKLPFLTKLTLDLNMITSIEELYKADFPSLC